MTKITIMRTELSSIMDGKFKILKYKMYSICFYLLEHMGWSALSVMDIFLDRICMRKKPCSWLLSSNFSS